MSSTVIAAIATAVILSAILSLVVYRLVSFLRQFRELPGFPGSRVAADSDVKPEDVASALDYATLCLSRYGPWKAGQVVEVVSLGLTIVVMRSDAWVDPFGRKVAGTQVVGGDGQSSWLQVGHDLAALCHELAHACEMRFDGQTDDAHLNWADRGLHRAADEYQLRYPPGSTSR